MAAIVNLGGVSFGGATNQVGVFNGQNMQNAWDSNAGNISVTGTLMGQFSAQYSVISNMNNWMGLGEPIIDNDIKNNGTPMIVGP